MKIDRIKIYLIKSGMIHPVIVEIVTDEGITGIGEAAIAYGLGGTAAAGMVKDISERIILGKDPFRIEQLWTEMYDHSFWAKGGGPIVFAGISAIEQALWDIKGKALGVSVYELLGGKIHDRVKVYANGWNYEFMEASDWAKAAEKPLKDGYKSLKAYPFAGPDEKGTLRHVTRRSAVRHDPKRNIDRDLLALGYARVKMLRDCVGPDVEILLDLSGGLTTDETIRFCHQVEEFNIGWIEEPADAFDITALKKVSDQISMPVAVGERLYTRYGFRRVFDSVAADIVQPDIGNTGGVLETKKIAAMAEAYNMRFAPHNCASALSTAVSLNLSVNIPNFMTLEIYPYFSRHPAYVEVLDHPPEDDIRDGYLEVSDRPGYGVSLAHDRIEPFLWAECVA